MGRRKITHEEHVLSVREIHGYTIRVIGTYQGVRCAILYKCTCCGSTWTTTPFNIVNQRNGCTTCTNNRVGGYNTRSVIDKTLYLYLIKLDQCLKIGLSVDPAKRHKDIQRAMGSSTLKILLLQELDGTTAFYIEQKVLTQFTRYNSPIKFGGYTELLQLSQEEDILYAIEYSIKNYLLDKSRCGTV